MIHTTKGNAQSITISLYPQPHIEAVNHAIKYRGYKGPTEFIQHLIEKDLDEDKNRFVNNLLIYILMPFFIIVLLMLYSRATENIYLYWISGGISSLFFYSMWIGIKKMKGQDTKIKRKKKVKHAN